jgi:Zn ribbon nucleic-acid-binding protein
LFALADSTADKRGGNHESTEAHEYLPQINEVSRCAAGILCPQVEALTDLAEWRQAHIVARGEVEIQHNTGGQEQQAHYEAPHQAHLWSPFDRIPSASATTRIIVAHGLRRRGWSSGGQLGPLELSFLLM